jgi:hypothetical protein
MYADTYRCCSACAIWAAPRHRQPNISDDDHESRVIVAGKQNRQFIGALVERFRRFSDRLLHLVASIAVQKILTVQLIRNEE